MSEVTLTAQTGREFGDGPSRRLRGEGKIPAVVYGMGGEPVAITIERSDLRKALTTEAGVNALIRLEVDGAKFEHTLVKEIQRHPVRRDPIHIDFLRIDPEKPMTLDVPILQIGEAKKVTSNGGITEQVMQTLRVTVRPDSIPTEFKADISNLVIDSHISVGDLVLPSGVTTEVDPAAAVITATLTRAALVALRQARAIEGGEEAEEEAI